MKKFTPIIAAVGAFFTLAMCIRDRYQNLPLPVQLRLYGRNQDERSLPEFCILWRHKLKPLILSKWLPHLWRHSKQINQVRQFARQ